MGGGFGGSMLDAVNKIAQNRAKLNSKKNKFKPNSKGHTFSEAKKTEYNFKKVSKEELAQIKSKIHLKAKEENRRRNFKIALLCLFVIIIFVLLNTIEFNSRIEWLDGKK